jgi:hypothetical protein
MPTDSLLAQILLTRSEARLLFEVQPSTKLQSKIEACDLAIDYLCGHPRAFAVRCQGHGNLSASQFCSERGEMNVRERVGSGTLEARGLKSII